MENSGVAKDVNFVHKDENWRQRVKSEHLSQKGFKDSWGYLVPEEGEEGGREQTETKLIKYYTGNKNGPSWTVKEIKVRKGVSADENGEMGTVDAKGFEDAIKTGVS
uniref:Uncharacterized protein n=1 Tax=Palpitomonas bilix TaxID=652834 RepID=A0A7S3DGZ0_9EUKA|mmetsp:Transcript_36865/g.95467  ORF Transcript_36865/g.95467 Transcript_36865/m.95467 type:complete len:107 (+) Transcript_36865:232-552(+)